MIKKKKNKTTVQQCAHNLFLKDFFWIIYKYLNGTKVQFLWIQSFIMCLIQSGGKTRDFLEDPHDIAMKILTRRDLKFGSADQLNSSKTFCEGYFIC